MEFKRGLALDGLLVGLREDNSSVMVATSARRSHGDPAQPPPGERLFLVLSPQMAILPQICPCAPFIREGR